MKDLQSKIGLILIYLTLTSCSKKEITDGNISVGIKMPVPL